MAVPLLFTVAPMIAPYQSDPPLKLTAALGAFISAKLDGPPDSFIAPLPAYKIWQFIGMPLGLLRLPPLRSMAIGVPTPFTLMITVPESMIIGLPPASTRLFTL